jgi:hypothetical protein
MYVATAQDLARIARSPSVMRNKAGRREILLPADGLD